MRSPRFTIFTPSFNRSVLLGRVYASLCAQTLQDFEWLIVDDGSTDDTAARVSVWQNEAPFTVRYVFQSNQGKHHAHNKALRHARGELCGVLDSDDSLVPKALERLAFHWNAISMVDRPRYSGVACLCWNERSQIVGQPYPADVLDCHPYKLWSKHRVAGEKWGVHATDVLRQYPFPEFAGERYCPEGLVWNRIGGRYLMRHVNEPLRVYHTESSEVTPNVRSVLMRSPRYTSLYFRECLGFDSSIPSRVKSAVSYIRYSLHAGLPLRDAISQSPTPLLSAVSALSGAAIYHMDRFLVPDCRKTEAMAE